MTNQLPENNMPREDSEKTKNVFEIVKKPKIPNWAYWLVLGVVILVAGGAVWWSWKTEKPTQGTRITCQQDSDCVSSPKYEGRCPKGCEIEAVNIETEKRRENDRARYNLKGCQLVKCSIPDIQAVCEQNRCAVKEKQNIQQGVLAITNETKYLPEESIQITLSNTLNKPIWYEIPCGGYLTILRQDNEIWQKIEDFSQKNCELSFGELKPNENKKFEINLRNYNIPKTESHRYKISFTIQIEYGKQLTNTYSNEFIIENRFVSLMPDEKEKVKSVFNTYLLAEEKCDIDLANSVITEKSKEIMHYTCANMASERKCYVDKNTNILTKQETAVLYFDIFNHKESWPFFFAKENGVWKIDFYKMANGIAMGGGGCATGWGWKNKEIIDEFCGYFPEGKCPE